VGEKNGSIGGRLVLNQLLHLSKLFHKQHVMLRTGINGKKNWIGQLQSKRLIHRNNAKCWRPYRLHLVPHASCGQLQSKRLDTLVICVLSVAVLACSLQKAIH
jgi:hypothetical protein